MTDQLSSETPPKKPMSSLPILIGLGLIIGFGAIFLFEFLQLSRPSGGLDDESITADAYLADVTPLLENADPERGRQLLSAKGCIGCHANNLAPSYAETHREAGNRRPPMTAQGYLYESIVFPNAFMVGDYPTNMPMNYVDSLTTAEIGDIIAYLLSPLAEAP
jgi:cytochrome c